jgi:CBS-domain-containing membrane protein
MVASKKTHDASKGQERARPGPELPFSAAALHAPVSAIMETDVACVQEDLSEEELINFFVVRGVHAAPVLGEGGVLSGFVSLVDVRRRPGADEAAPRVELRGGGGYALGRGFHVQPARTVAEIMTRPAICLDASAQLTQAAALMAFEGVSRLPIVDAQQRVVGVLLALDLLRWMGRQDGYSIPEYTQRSRQRTEPESE